MFYVPVLSLGASRGCGYHTIDTVFVLCNAASHNPLLLNFSLKVGMAAVQFAISKQVRFFAAVPPRKSPKIWCSPKIIFKLKVVRDLYKRY